MSRPKLNRPSYKIFIEIQPEVHEDIKLYMECSHATQKSIVLRALKNEVESAPFRQVIRNKLKDLARRFEGWDDEKDCLIEEKRDGGKEKSQSDGVSFSKIEGCELPDHLTLHTRFSGDSTESDDS